jgi:hypothetical protein
MLKDYTERVDPPNNLAEIKSGEVGNNAFTVEIEDGYKPR